MIGRRRFYAKDEIGDVPCARCGSASTQQWQVCALDNRYLGICDACDIALNRAVLEFMFIPDFDGLMAKYAAKVARRRRS